MRQLGVRSQQVYVQKASSVRQAQQFLSPALLEAIVLKAQQSLLLALKIPTAQESKASPTPAPQAPTALLASKGLCLVLQVRTTRKKEREKEKKRRVLLRLSCLTRDHSVLSMCLGSIYV